MSHTKKLSWVLPALLGLATATQAAVFTASGPTPADIQGAVDSFRTALGGANNGVGGTFATGRREINWDAVPAGFSAPNNLPGNFFNSNSARGLEMATPGTGFQVSANAGGAEPIEFGGLNNTYPDLFQPFSAQKIFTVLGSNTLSIRFFVPGTNIAASVLGFGAVFTDVNVTTGTRFTVFYADGSNGGQFAIPVGPAGGLSFLGLTDPANRYSRIDITLPSALGPNQNLTNLADMVAMDDFIYGEPQAIDSAVPEPSTVLLTAGGIALVALRARRRK